MTQKRLAYELHKPKRKNFPTRPVVVKAIRESWQADLVDMQHLAKWNKGARYLLSVIDTTSKMAYAIALKTKTANEVAAAFKEILEETGYSPKHLQTDQGTEFFNARFKALMKAKDINHYHSHSERKASIVERWQRTLKEKMYRYFTEYNTLKWTDALPHLVEAYNHTKHRSISMKPIEVSKRNEKEVLTRLSQRKPIRPQRRFFVGDVVRVSRMKNIFGRGFTQNWTEELFKVSDVLLSRPRTYKLVDLRDQPIKGSFYSYELQRTEIPDYARIEKVLARKGLPNGKRMIRVRWKGYSNEFNEWIPAERAEKL